MRRPESLVKVMFVFYGLFQVLNMHEGMRHSEISVHEFSLGQPQELELVTVTRLFMVTLLPAAIDLRPYASPSSRSGSHSAVEMKVSHSPLNSGAVRGASHQPGLFARISSTCSLGNARAPKYIRRAQLRQGALAYSMKEGYGALA